MERTDLAQDRDQWRDLVNTVIKLSGSKKKKVGEILEKLSHWRLFKTGSSPWS
jgi:hypothetical protein